MPRELFKFTIKCLELFQSLICKYGCHYRCDGSQDVEEEWEKGQQIAEWHDRFWASTSFFGYSTQSWTTYTWCIHIFKSLWLNEGKYQLWVSSIFQSFCSSWESSVDDERSREQSTIRLYAAEHIWRHSSYPMIQWDDATGFPHWVGKVLCKLPSKPSILRPPRDKLIECQ